MISGILAISIAFVASTVATAAYWLYYKENDERFYNLANRGFAIMGVGVIFSVVLLYFNIFTHNFQLDYVYSYTSTKLSTYYLISTFWAGQQGTFLLWLMYATVFGIILIRTVAKKQPMVMFFLMLVQSFLLLILLKKSPFSMIWNVHPDAAVGMMPADGRGLNPLLQNPWMIIHPPIMFVGYSSTVVAFSLALSAMVTRNFQGWIKTARPWVLFTTLTLGTGVIMGGYWSYVTLGWGGYWAWDPVENASFVPWLFTAVLLHGLVIQDRQKGLVKTNLFLAGLAFISVLWGSFLTRSGVLADFSVHSFAESDLNLYLIALVTFFSGIFIYQYFKSVKLIDSPRFAEGIFSRESFMLIGMMSILFTGITVFIGTSAPIYTGLFGKPSNVSQNFYNTISIPVAFFMLLSMAIAPLLAWKISDFRKKGTIGLSAAAALLVTAVSVALGLTKPVSIVLVFLSIFAIVINSKVSFQFLKKIPTKSGAYLSHVGIAMMVIGIITSSMYSTSEKVTLPEGQFTKTQFGYDIQFVNFVNNPDGKERAKLLVKKEDGGENYVALPQFYFSDYTQSYMVSPHVKVGMAKDIYISPISFIPGEKSDNQQVELTRNSTQTVGDIKVTFNKFDVSNHMENAPTSVKADLTIAVQENSNWKDYSIAPAMWMENGKLESDEAAVPNTGYKIRIESLDASQGMVRLAVMKPSTDQPAGPNVLAVEVSEKPLISILWFGALVFIGGVGLTLADRFRKA